MALPKVGPQLLPTLSAIPAVTFAPPNFPLLLIPPKSLPPGHLGETSTSPRPSLWPQTGKTRSKVEGGDRSSAPWDRAREAGRPGPGRRDDGGPAGRPGRPEGWGRAGGGAPRRAASPSRSLGGEQGKLPGLGSRQLCLPALQSRPPVPGASPPLPRLPQCPPWPKPTTTSSSCC